jgi:hypothetical protein
MIHFPIFQGTKLFTVIFICVFFSNLIFTLLVTLIDSLEFVSLSRGFEPEWGCNLLRKLNIPFNKLIQAYNSVDFEKDVKWTENSSRFLNSIFSLIELFTKAPNATNESDKYFNNFNSFNG